MAVRDSKQFSFIFSARTITAEDNYNNDNIDQDEEDDELLRLKQQKRSKSRTSTKPISRPNSSAMRKNSATSRPSSVALFQHPLYVNYLITINNVFIKIF
jgi:hypothetical protein